MVEFDRPRGILTEKDRRYLHDNVLPDTKQAAYERREGARRRIRNGLKDLPAIRFLPPDERRKLFDDLEPSDDLYRALVSAVALTKYACDDAGFPVEELLEEGLRLGAQPTRGDLVEPGENPHSPFDNPAFPGETGRKKTLRGVNVEIEYEYADAYYPETLRKQFLEGEELNDDELLVLVKSDEFDDEVAAEIQARRDDKS